MPNGEIGNPPKGNYVIPQKGNSISNIIYNNNLLPEITSETTSDIKEKNIKKENPSNFQKPTLEELESYAKEIKANFSVNQFFDYYEANGWKVGKNAMKNWKATMRMWKHRNQNTQNQNQTKSLSNDEELNKFFAKQVTDEVLSNNWLSKGLPHKVKEFNQNLDNAIGQEFKRKFLTGE
ncbi:MAG: hypothetical protein IKK93_06795 [Campylobacter sp.]|nr:hypothetical protein [Campylobacter sp.]